MSTVLEAVRGQPAPEASPMDEHALIFEVRRDLGRALKKEMRGEPTKSHLFDADRRLIHLDNLARRHAAEAAGITFLSPGQLPLPDGCFGDDGGAA